MELFWSLVHLHGGPAPVRRFLPELIDLIWRREIDSGEVFDLETATSTRRPRDTRPWTKDERSRPCFAREDGWEASTRVK
jgi:hypothetical protein